MKKKCSLVYCWQAPHRLLIISDNIWWCLFRHFQTSQAILGSAANFSFSSAETSLRAWPKICPELVNFLFLKSLNNSIMSLRFLSRDNWRGRSPESTITRRKRDRILTESTKLHLNPLHRHFERKRGGRHFQWMNEWNFVNVSVLHTALPCNRTDWIYS